MTLKLTSTGFAEGGAIPEQHTCEGDDLSPHLAWTGAPAGTKSFALIVDDPDAPDPAAPRMTWVHWVLYDIPAGVKELIEDADPADLPEGCRDGLNDWGRSGYGGPGAPPGRDPDSHNAYAPGTPPGGPH